MVQLSHPCTTTGKHTADYTDLCWQSDVSSKEHASFNFVVAVIVCSDLGAQESKICHCFHFSPFYLPWSDGIRCHNLRFWMFSFKSGFSLSSFTLIKRLFTCSSLSAIRVVSSTYLRLLIFLLATLIPACASSSPAFHVIYSVYTLNKHGDNIQPWHTPFPIWNQSIVLCLFLTVAPLHAYRFLRRQVRWSGIPIWLPRWLSGEESTCQCRRCKKCRFDP